MNNKINCVGIKYLLSIVKKCCKHFISYPFVLLFYVLDGSNKIIYRFRH